jgi:hypothetical protein
MSKRAADSGLASNTVEMTWQLWTYVLLSSQIFVAGEQGADMRRNQVFCPQKQMRRSHLSISAE